MSLQQKMYFSAWFNAKMHGVNAIKMRGAKCLHWMDKKPQTTTSQEFYSWTWLQFTYPTEVLEYKVCFHILSVEIIYIWERFFVHSEEKLK